VSSLKFNPANNSGHFNLANIYFNQGKFDLAAQYYENLIKLNPKDAEARQNLGQFYSSIFVMLLKAFFLL
jgi:tetratricopeptide (TPR) repeat protein